MSRTNATEPNKRPPNELIPNPKQAAYFSAPSDVEIERLAADIKTNGLKVPVSILPDNTIVSGHSRVAAAKLLGMQTIDVVVRHDLAEDAIAAERELVSDNLNRRQLSPLDQARCVQFLVDSTGAELSVCDRYREIGRQLGMSDRSVRRYLAALKLPRYFQTEFEQGKLSNADAAKILRQPSHKQTELAAKAERGESIHNLLKERRTKKHVQPDVKQTYQKLIGVLKEANPLLDRPTVAAMEDLSRRDKQALEVGKATLDRLLESREKLKHSLGMGGLGAPDTVSKFPEPISRGNKKKPPAK